VTEGAVTEPLDRGMLMTLALLVDEVTTELDRYEYARALLKIEGFFWDFCDNYVEAVKSRRYGDFGAEAAQSAATASRLALSVMLRLLAPYLSFACEDVWSWWKTGSVHRAAWPTRAEVEAVSGADEGVRQSHVALADALAAIRKAKSDHKLSVGAEVADVVCTVPPEAFAALSLVQRDLRAAVRAARLTLLTGDVSVTVTPRVDEA
jgi:valyl-tRNA synthetase